MSPADYFRRPQSGVTLVELVVFIVIVSVGIAGILSVFNVAVRGSVNPLEPKQSLAIAEALLEEVQQAPFTWCDPNDPVAETATKASDCTIQEVAGPEAGDARPFDNVSDYDGFALTTITDVSGVAVPGLTGYSASIAVTPSALGNIPLGADMTVANAAAIRVTVTAPSGAAYTLQGFRTRYAPNAIP